MIRSWYPPRASLTPRKRRSCDSRKAYLRATLMWERENFTSKILSNQSNKKKYQPSSLIHHQSRSTVSQRMKIWVNPWLILIQTRKYTTDDLTLVYACNSHLDAFEYTLMENQIADNRIGNKIGWHVFHKFSNPRRASPDPESDGVLKGSPE